MNRIILLEEKTANAVWRWHESKRILLELGFTIGLHVDGWPSFFGDERDFSRRKANDRRMQIVQFGDLVRESATVEVPEVRNPRNGPQERTREVRQRMKAIFGR
jgi:hypothetical protein